jgi:DNA polymerase (family 10)
MDNKAIADRLEIDGQDSFRVRSYRDAAQVIEAPPQQIANSKGDPKNLLEVPSIGKGMLANLQHLFQEGIVEVHAELLKKYRPSMLELLKIQGLGPKTIIVPLEREGFVGANGNG